MSYHDKDYYAIMGMIETIETAQDMLAIHIINGIQNHIAEKQAQREAEWEEEMYWKGQYNDLVAKHNNLVEEFNKILAASRGRMANLNIANERLVIYKDAFEEARNLAWRHAILIVLLGEHLREDREMNLDQVMEGALKHLPDIRQKMPDDPKAVYNWWAAPNKLENREALVEFIPSALKPKDFIDIDAADEIKNTL